MFNEHRACSDTPEFEQKVERINDTLQELFESGIVEFDMGAGFDVQEHEGGKFVVSHPSFEDIEQVYQIKSMDMKAKGPCRRLTPAIAGKLLQLGLIKNVQYMIDDVKVTTHRYLHTAFLAEVDGQRMFFDVARRTPFLKVVPLDGSSIQSGERIYTLSPAGGQIVHQSVKTEGSDEKKSIFWRPFEAAEELETLIKTFHMYTRWQVMRAVLEDGEWKRRPSEFSPVQEKAFETFKKRPDQVELRILEEGQFSTAQTDS